MREKEIAQMEKGALERTNRAIHYFFSNTQKFPTFWQF